MKDLSKSSLFRGFSGSSDSKEFTCNVRDLGSISVWGRSPGVGNDNPLQCSYLENSMDRGGWAATVHGVAESDMKPDSSSSP